MVRSERRPSASTDGSWPNRTRQRRTVPHLTGEERVMLLARVAEAVYWAGRYLERAEDMARIVQVHGETHVDLPVGEDVGWAPLLEIAGPTRPGTRNATASWARGRHRPPSSGSVRGGAWSPSCSPTATIPPPSWPLDGARDNLRVARPVVPREVWELINELWLALSPDRHHRRRPRPTGALAATRHRRDPAYERGHAGHHASGRGDGLLPDRPAARAGRDHVSRPGGAGRQRRVRPGHEVYDEVHWMALLRSLASYQPFRRAMPARPDATSTLRFLLQDEAFPRAVCACLSELRDLVKGLPRNERSSRPAPMPPCWWPMRLSPT